MADEWAGDFRSTLLASLPRIEAAVIAGEADASFSMTVQLSPRKKKVKGVTEITGFGATLKPRERVPLEPIEYELKLEDGQLELFEKAV